MGASGFSQLIKMEVSPTSSTSWSEGASGATDRPRCEFKNTKTDGKQLEMNRFAIVLSQLTGGL